MGNRGAPKGERNGRWNGGSSEYPNHSEMKKIRKEILEQAGYKCHFCDGFANEIHHKDKSKDNHLRDNLVACCHGCNHKGENIKLNTSKFKRLYGFTFQELLEKKVFKSFYYVQWSSAVRERLRVGL